ncbi:MAG: amidase [Gemmatimonadales bacterium]
MPMDADLAELSATELHELTLKGDVTAVEIVEASLERIERYNPRLNAVVTLSETALDDARTLDAERSKGKEPGLLFGLPAGIKDVTPVAGMRTTFGSPMYADYVPDTDALVVRRLRDAGAVIVGKTNCPEFAAGGNTWNEVFGRTCNPWDTSRSAGGSTGGGAVGLATGMIKLAEGTDLGGSLRIPASFCGVLGLRPSPGLVPTHPTDFLWDNLQVTGPMARTARDVALMLQAVSGPSELSPMAQPNLDRNYVGATTNPSAKNLRLAYCPDIAGIGVDRDVEHVCRRAAFELNQAGAVVEEVNIDLSYGRDAFIALRGLWMVAHQHTRLQRRDELGVNVRANIELGLDVTTEQLAAAEHDRARVRYFFRDLFEKYDHLLTPAMAVPPFPVEQNYPETVAGKKMETYIDWIAPTFVLSLTALPVAAVPCGVDGQGLPVGLQVVGRPFGEEAVLRLAAVIEQQCPMPQPPLDLIS